MKGASDITYQEYIEQKTAKHDIWISNQRHFSNVARKYKQLRMLQRGVIPYISEYLSIMPHVHAVDIGCGAGRYDSVLLDKLGDKLNLVCLDANLSMLKQLKRTLCTQDDKKCVALLGLAGCLPLTDNSYDAVLTLNAIHHFPLESFLHESSRILRKNGYLFIFTRLRSQNKRNIWGRHFPKFHEKETRLYEHHELEHAIKQITCFRITDVKRFLFKRTAPLNRLLLMAAHHHYSTFYLYSEDELKEAMNIFKNRLLYVYSDPNNISWNDENILFIVQKARS